MGDFMQNTEMQGAPAAQGSFAKELGKAFLAVLALSLALAAVMSLPDLAEEAGISGIGSGLWSGCGARSRDLPIEPDLGKAAWCALGSALRSSDSPSSGGPEISLPLPERR